MFRSQIPSASSCHGRAPSAQGHVQRRQASCLGLQARAATAERPLSLGGALQHDDDAAGADAPVRRPRHAPSRREAYWHLQDEQLWSSEPQAHVQGEHAYESGGHGAAADRQAPDTGASAPSSRAHRRQAGVRPQQEARRQAAGSSESHQQADRGHTRGGQPNKRGSAMHGRRARGAGREHAAAAAAAGAEGMWWRAEDEGQREQQPQGIISAAAAAQQGRLARLHCRIDTMLRSSVDLRHLKVRACMHACVCCAAAGTAGGAP